MSKIQDDNKLYSFLRPFVDYHVKKAFVVSNERTVTQKDKIIYIPIYYIMFLQNNSGNGASL